LVFKSQVTASGPKPNSGDGPLPGPEVSREDRL